MFALSLLLEGLKKDDNHHGDSATTTCCLIEAFLEVNFLLYHAPLKMIYLLASD